LVGVCIDYLLVIVVGYGVGMFEGDCWYDEVFELVIVVRDGEVMFVIYNNWIWYVIVIGDCDGVWWYV